MGWQFTPFVITPDELKTALEPFSLFIGNTRVPAEYSGTPADVFIGNYSILYEQLCGGRKIDYRAHNGTLDYFSVTTDMDSVLWRGCEPPNEGFKVCAGTNRGLAPYFMPFTLSIYESDSKVCVSTRGSWMIDSTSIMGFQLAFPRLSRSEAGYYGISSEREWPSHGDYRLFRKLISKHTEPLRLLLNGTERRTDIRVSPGIKEALSGFHCIRQYGAEII